MNVGFVGLGKLGLPVAAAIASKGHTVCGTDANPAVAGYIVAGDVPYQEAGLCDLTQVRWCDTVAEVVASSELVFVAVQTPHDPAYEGVTPAPADKRDFEYQYLANAYREVCRHATTQTVAVISTVLPGTMQRVILPQGAARTVYNPFFIAMGTTTADFLEPEFVIVGADDPVAVDHMRRFYKTIHARPVVTTSIASAELVKVAYNGVISAKIVLANWVGEICEKTAADADEVHAALSHAVDRLWSPRYFRSGMGDGGGCHPRDNIALSYLAERLDLSVDVGGWVTAAREAHCQWLADIVKGWCRQTGLQAWICGREYKPETNLTNGSPSRLLASMLLCGFCDYEPAEAGVYVIGCDHAKYRTWQWPKGSVIVDPFGNIPDTPGVTVHRIGR
jgi:UDPglucose 6-dehydrogenase